MLNHTVRFRLALALAGIAVASVAHAANQVVSNCSNDTELRSDLTAMQNGDGGTLTFACAASTIVLTADLPAISKNTTIDGDDDVAVSGGNSRRIFFVNGGVTLTLRNIELTNGFSTGDGGAIYSNGGLALQDVTIRNSVAGLSGGALISYGPVMIEDSELAENEAVNAGAVFARFEGAPTTIRRSILRDNMALQDSGLGGAILLWDGADLTIEETQITGNWARNGGGISNPFANSSVTIDNTLVMGNHATTDHGGGISVTGGFLQINDSELSFNVTAASGGAIYYTDGTSLTIGESVIHDNSAAGAGGGVAVRNSTGVSFVNTTISGNDASDGGGLNLGNSTTFILHATIVQNESVGAGDGLKHFSENFRTTSLKNTVLQNPHGDNCAPDGPNKIISEDGNVSSDISCEGILTKTHDSNSTDPKLGPLAWNGGPTPTHLPAPGSPVVDHAVTTIVNTDQRRVPRPQGGAADSGAVEIASCPPGPAMCGDANENQTISSSDALKVLQAAVGSAGNCPLYLCDYNGSGDLTASDALSVLRKAVGSESSAPACPAKWDCHELP